MFGSHLSIAGGMHNALLEAEQLGMETVQVFTKNQQQWKSKPLDPAAISQWTTERDRLKFGQSRQLSDQSRQCRRRPLAKEH
jgi:endonuclease IV